MSKSNIYLHINNIWKKNLPTDLDIDCVKKAHIYEILDNYGHHPFMNYYMKEETTFFCRFFCENLRRLKISLCSNDGQEVLRFERPLQCRAGWFSQVKFEKKNLI